MADSPTEPVPRRPSRPLRGILRWMGRFLVRALVVLAGLSLLLGALAALLYVNRVRLVNETLARLVDPFHTSVGEIHFHRAGQVRIENLRLAPKGVSPGKTLAVIPEILVTYRFDDLRSSRRLRGLLLNGAEIRLDEEILAAFSAGGAHAGPSAPPSLELLSLFTGPIRILGSRLILDLDSLPRLETELELRAGPFEFDADGTSAEPVSLILDNLSLGEGGANGSIRRLAAKARLSADLSLAEIEFLRVVAPSLHLTPDLFPAQTKASEADHAAGPEDKSPTLPELHFRSVEIARANLSLAGFDGRDGRPLLPDFRLSTSFSCEGLSLRKGRWEHDSPLELVLARIGIGSEEAPLFSADRVALLCEDLEETLASRRIPPIRLEHVDLLLSDRSLAWLGGEKADGAPTERGDSVPAPPWTLSEISFAEGKLLLRDLGLGGRAAPTLATAFEATLRELALGGEAGFESEATQSLRLERTRLDAPGAAVGEEPLVSLDSAEIELRWPDLRDEGIVARLTARGPRVHFTDESLGDWLEGIAAPPSDSVAAEEPTVYKVADLSVEGGQLVADSNFAEGRVPKIHADFTLANDRSPEAPPYAYDLILRDFEVRNHPRFLEPGSETVPAPEAGAAPTRRASPLAESEVFRVAEISAAFTAEGLQRTRRVEQLRLDGAVLTVGEGLKSLAGEDEEEAEEEATPDAPAPPPAPPAAPPAQAAAPSAGPPAWTIGEVAVTRSRVQFQALIPQIEGLEFDIETRLFEVPLSLDGLLAQEASQKIELAGIEIKDPYSSFITVAELPTIFVEFSLAGLGRQEIERIDLVGPSLHVGQGLFWWIEYQRKHREANEGARIGIEATEAPSRPDWVIKTINASAGQIVVAPTGIPLGVVPFPFNATTNMSEGDIELKLNIPDEDHVYRFPDFKVELEGLVGDIQFNVPVKDEDNNLVQTFTLKRAKWKDFDAEDLYITVTFDAAGIYGLFGGAAYGGYAEGGFDFYLEDSGKWDAWVAGTSLDSGPITRLVTPGNFLMDGRISLKLITEGRDKTLGRTSGEFRSESPGWFDISKLDDMLSNLPPEWSSLQRDLTEISLEALKRFDYDRAVGSLSFLDLDGGVDLRFDGPYGSRSLNLKLHDRREGAATAALAAETTTAVPEADENSQLLPEASARPVAVPAGPSRVAASLLRPSKR